VVVLQAEAQLLQVIDALIPPGGLAGGLHGREQQGDQYGDDGDHDQQFDQRETAQAPTRGRERRTMWSLLGLVQLSGGREEWIGMIRQ
jgi:hypothetical protein